MDDWPARHCWSPEYLCTALGEKSVSINVTPNGRGDAVTSDGYFAMPEERTMTFAEFVATLRDKSNDEVCYLSHQNDNLRTQLGDARAGSSLAQDVPASIPFVDEALGHPPDAVGSAVPARVCFPKVALPSLLAPDLAPL
jgi:jumonji domain-containing protein 7